MKGLCYKAFKVTFLTTCVLLVSSDQVTDNLDSNWAIWQWEKTLLKAAVFRAFSVLFFTETCCYSHWPKRLTRVIFCTLGLSCWRLFTGHPFGKWIKCWIILNSSEISCVTQALSSSDCPQQFYFWESQIDTNLEKRGCDLVYLNFILIIFSSEEGCEWMFN